MELDHIFIFSTSDGREGDELVDFGLEEGPSRRHVGQGTANRTFLFKNGYLEIIWAVDQAELTSELVAPTGLWERANHRTTGWCPFGLCLVNTPETDGLFASRVSYQPKYFPPGQAIEIVKGEKSSKFPLVFRLPRGLARSTPEPPAHPANVSKITRVEFGLAAKPAVASPFDLLAGEPWLGVRASPRPLLTLNFDNQRQRRSRPFEHLPLVIEY